MKKVTLLLAGILLSCLIVYSQNFQISSSEDDVEESVAFGTVLLNSPVIDLTADPSSPQTMKQTIGLRFNNVNLERGTPLKDCYLAFVVDQPSKKFSLLSIVGEKSPDALPFKAVKRDLFLRKKTAAKVNWNNVEAWNEAGVVMKSPDLSNVLMEIINQNDWKPGNSIVLMISGNGDRHSVAYDKNPEMAAQLVLNDASGNRYKKPVIVQRPAPQPQPQNPPPPSPPVATDECNIPEPPVGLAKSAYLQGNAYMDNEDFKSAESRFSMAIDNLKHPRFYISRAAARQLLDRFSDAQDDISQAIALGVDGQMAQKCFQDLVDLHKNFEKIDQTYETCFSKNTRALYLPPCPIRITVGNGKATLFMDTHYQNTYNKSGETTGKHYNSIIVDTDWVINPGKFYDCNPNISTTIKPKNVNTSMAAKTSGWFEIPTKMTLTNMYMNGDDVIRTSVVESNDWFLVGYFFKDHTGETLVTGGFYKADGNSAPLRIGDD